MHRLGLFLLLSLFVTLPALASPTVAVSESSVTVTGLSPGAEVWLYGVSRYVDGYRRTLEITSEVLPDADDDGTVTYEPPFYGIERVSVWVAAERASGAVALGARSDYPAQVSSLTSVALASTAEAVTLPRRRVEALLLRSGGKAWSLTLGDGAAADSDGLEDGQVTLLPSALISQTADPEKPGAFGKDDVLVVIDRQTLEVLVSAPALADPGLAAPTATAGEAVAR